MNAVELPVHIRERLEAVERLDNDDVFEHLDILGWRGIDPAQPLNVVRTVLEERTAAGKDVAFIVGDLEWIQATLGGAQ